MVELGRAERFWRDMAKCAGHSPSRASSRLRLFRAAATPKIRPMTSAAATQFLPVVANAIADNDSLVVSIHDIAPSNRNVVDPLLTKLNRLGVHVSSLL